MSEQQTKGRVGDSAVVLVDQWGHRGEFLRGDIVQLSDLNPNEYDAQSALDRGVIRLLSEAEIARPPTTHSIEGGESSAASMRAAAGFSDEVPTTVTTAQGPAEPPELSKPTIAFTGTNDPAPHPVQIAGQAGESTTQSGAPRPSAAELADRAHAATTPAELDEIDALADNRMTSVHDAVAQRRAELAGTGSTPPSTESPKEEG
jgi:hypothetical protein